MGAGWTGRLGCAACHEHVERAPQGGTRPRPHPPARQSSPNMPPPPPPLLLSPPGQAPRSPRGGIGYRGDGARPLRSRRAAATSPPRPAHPCRHPLDSRRVLRGGGALFPSLRLSGQSEVEPRHCGAVAGMHASGWHCHHHGSRCASTIHEWRVSTAGGSFRDHDSTGARMLNLRACGIGWCWDVLFLWHGCMVHIWM